MRKVKMVLLILLLPFALFAQTSQNTKPGVTVNLRDGRTASGRLDAFDDKRVLIFDKTNKAVYYDRDKVNSIAITTDASGRFSPGQEGIVLKNGTVLKGRVRPMDFSNRDMPNVVVQTGRRLESSPLSDVAFVQFEKPFPETRPLAGAVRALVPAYQQWTETSVSVKKGDRMFFSVSSDNYISCGPRSIDVNADGANPFWADRSRPIPDAKECALIAKVGRQSAPFRVGLNTTPFVAQDDGTIQLGINDYDFRDNSGELLVFIRVESGGTFQPGTPGMSQNTVSVPANQQWTMTGIDVKKDQRLQFDVPADNTIGCNRRPIPTNAEGVDPYFPDNRRPMPSLKACALIGRINNGAPFKIGLNKTPIVIQQDGKLLLGINEFDVRFNTGAFNVTVLLTK
jgi:hypothetical protein